MTFALQDRVTRLAPIDTWFGVGGSADAYAEPETLDELRSLIDLFEGDVRVLGDGANLLVDDDGVGGLVVSLRHFSTVTPFQAAGMPMLTVGAGVNLPKLVIQTVRDGLGGLETLAGVPASVGGATRMNAGGAFGEIANVIHTVRGVTLQGEAVETPRREIDFAYRHSGLENIIITEVELAMAPGDPAALRKRLKDVMAYKKHSQPMAEKSAGCVFRNPTVGGSHVSAGRLIDQAGCKGLRLGGADVSQVHGNFFITHPGATARDVLQLIEEVRQRVLTDLDVALETEVVIWKRETA